MHFHLKKNFWTIVWETVAIYLGPNVLTNPNTLAIHISKNNIVFVSRVFW